MLRGDCCGGQLPAPLTVLLMFLTTIGIQYRVLRKQKEAAMTNQRLHYETIITSILSVLLGVMVNVLSVEASP